MNLIFIAMHLQRAYVFVLAFFLKIENGKQFPVLNIQMRGKSLTCGYFVIGLSTSYIKPYKEKNKFFDNVHHTPKLQFFSLVLVIDLCNSVNFMSQQNYLRKLKFFQFPGFLSSFKIEQIFQKKNLNSENNDFGIEILFKTKPKATIKSEIFLLGISKNKRKLNETRRKYQIYIYFNLAKKDIKFYEKFHFKSICKGAREKSEIRIELI